MRGILRVISMAYSVTGGYPSSLERQLASCWKGQFLPIPSSPSSWPVSSRPGNAHARAWEMPCLRTFGVSTATSELSAPRGNAAYAQTVRRPILGSDEPQPNACGPGSNRRGTTESRRGVRLSGGRSRVGLASLLRDLITHVLTPRRDPNTPHGCRARTASALHAEPEAPAVSKCRAGKEEVSPPREAPVRAPARRLQTARADATGMYYVEPMLSRSPQYATFDQSGREYLPNRSCR